ncbi:MAG: D-alanine--D-alanine ligase, partial [Pseudomonadota bacterium]
MSSKRKFDRVVVLKGGPSAEREVSLVSGAECAKGLREAGYDVVEIDAGPDLAERLGQEKAAHAPRLAVFNALHGRWGEDGCVQGLLEWLRVPYTHSGVAASSIAMDKIRAKALFAAHGLPLAEHLVAPAEDIAARHLMAPPYVVKPANEGSSVGVHLVLAGANRPPTLASLSGPISPVAGAPADGADRVDPDDAERSWMLEKYVPGRELTVSVLGDRALCVTEIVSDGWYDYDAKYKAGGSRHVLPAEIPDAVADAARAMALTAHQALGCRGATRTDFRYDDSERPGLAGPEKLTVLETNSQPGMTPTSLLPEQAAHEGVG